MKFKNFPSLPVRLPRGTREYPLRGPVPITRKTPRSGGQSPANPEREDAKNRGYVEVTPDTLRKVGRYSAGADRFFFSD